jgi:hypothetical protein
LDVEACIASNVKFHIDLNRVNNNFGGYECFITLNEKKTDRDPIERKFSRKLALCTVSILNLKDLPSCVGEEEDGIRLKKPQWIIDKEYDYRKRWNNIIMFPGRINEVSMRNTTLDVIV